MLNSSEIKPLAHRIDDACRVLGIGRTALYSLIKRGELTAIKVAGRSLIPHAELERVVAAAQVTREAA